MAVAAGALLHFFFWKHKEPTHPRSLSFLPLGNMSAENSNGEKNLRLLVVSNRLPVTVKKDTATNQYEFKMSSGGLVAALSGLKKMMSFTWIGWPGRAIWGPCSKAVWS